MSVSGRVGGVIDRIRIVEKTIRFKVEKETKNSVRFTEVPAEGQPPIIGTLYVQKWFVGNAQELEVTVKKP